MQVCLLSELRVPMRELREALNPPNLEQALKTLQETKIPDKGRWCLSLIVREENGVWLGAGRREDGREVRVRYSGQFGLEIV